MAKVTEARTLSKLKFKGTESPKSKFFACALTKHYAIFATESSKTHANCLYKVNLETGEETLLINWPENIKNIYVSTNKNIIFLATKKEDIILDIETGNQISLASRKKKNCYIRCVGWLTNYSQLLAIEDYGKLSVYDIFSLKIERPLNWELEGYFADEFSNIIISTNDKYLFFTEKPIHQNLGNLEIVLLDIETGYRVCKYSSYVENINSMAVSPNGKFLLYSGSNIFLNDNDSITSYRTIPYAIQLLSIETGERTLLFLDKNVFIECIEFSSSGLYALLANCYGDVFILDMENKKLLKTFKIEHLAPLRKIIFSPDDKQFISIHFNNIICKWDIGFI